jgi:hypothetical protein
MLPPLGDAAVPWWTNTISIMPPIYSLSNALDTSGGGSTSEAGWRSAARNRGTASHEALGFALTAARINRIPPRFIVVRMLLVSPRAETMTVDFSSSASCTSAVLAGLAGDVAIRKRSESASRNSNESY